MKIIITIILTAIIAAVLAGGGIYWWQINQEQKAIENAINQEQAEFQQQISELRGQITKLKEENKNLQGTLLEEATLRIQKQETDVVADYSNSPLCTDPPTDTEIGRQVYPIDTQYKNIHFLGQIFTAYNCGEKRLNKIFGVEENNYTLGSAIWLISNPSQSLINILKSIGFTCDENMLDENCKKWELWEIIKVGDLIKLEPYYENFEMDDCINCG